MHPLRRLARTLALLTPLGFAPAAAAAQSDVVRAWREGHEHTVLSEFVALLSLPNVASDSAGIRRNAEFIVQMLRQREMNPRLLYASDPAAPPAVYGEWLVPGATRTLVFYAHYDGQPADPARWSGTDPWRPALRTARLDRGGELIPFPAAGEPLDPEWRLYARSAADDKAGVMAIVAAIDALRATGARPTSNVKVFFEGEEEAGSPNLADLLARHRELLAADAWIIADGPVHQSGRRQVVFGVRGDVNVDLTVYGPVRPLHSGHYGNWAPNPAMDLARLLATMKDDDGRVTIEGWYDDAIPLGEAEWAALRAAPRNDDALRAELGLSRTEGGGADLLELITLPSLNVNGMSAAEVGPLARNVIPTTATAVLDLRLVAGDDHRRQVEKLVRHVRARGYHVLDRDPTDEERRTHPRIARVVARGGGYNAARTPMDLPISQLVMRTVQASTPEPIVALPTLGGSLPLSIFHETLGVPTIIVPVVNHDNNQHAEDENLRLGNLWEGIELMAALMTF